MSDDPATADTPAPEEFERIRQTREFSYLAGGLPERIRKALGKAIRIWSENPTHPSLRLHQLKDTKKGRHLPTSFTVSINMQYRAIYVMDGPTAVWYWIGTHAQYDRFTGSS